jgi:hypothetical protein
MAITAFRLLHDAPLDVDIPALQSMLPSSMTVVDRDGAHYIDVKTSTEEDARAQFHVDRELDRLFFLTCVGIKAEMCTRTVLGEFRGGWSIHKPIPRGCKAQVWNYALGVQLRLWSIASEVTDPLAKILLMYQIIELSNPSFPPYSDPTKSPDPLMECKLLRDLVVHAGDVESRQLKAYCAHLNLPPVLLDRTDSSYVGLLSAKCKLLEEQAELVLASAL